MSELDLLHARQEALETANETLHEAFRTVDGDAHTALEVAKQNIKLMTALRATQLEHGRAIAGLVTEVAELKDGLTYVRGGLTHVRGGLTELKGDVTELKGDVTELKDGVAEMLRRLPERPE